MNSLDEEVRQLLREGKDIEAVRLVHNGKAVTLLEAKKYIDKLKADNCSWEKTSNIRSWNIEYKDGKPEHITFTDATGTHTAEPNSPEWMDILKEATQEGSGKANQTKADDKKTLLQRILDSQFVWLFISLVLLCLLTLFILCIYPSYFGLHT